MTNVGAVPSLGTVTLVLPGAVPNTFVTVTFTLATPLGVGQTVGFTTTYTMGTQTTAAQTFTAAVTGGPTETNLTNNFATVLADVGANVSGRAWFDAGVGGRQIYNPGTDIPLRDVLVRLANAFGPVATAFTDVNGQYEIRGVRPATNYSIQFFRCANPSTPSTCVVIGTTPLNQGPQTQRYGVANNATTVPLNPVPSVTGVTIGNAITGITLIAGDNTINQNLPIDPASVVYDSVTRLPVAGATVSVSGPPGFAGFIQNGNGVISTTQVTAIDGRYQFFLMPGFVPGTYTLSVGAPGGYFPILVTQTTFAVAGGVVPPTAFPGVVPPGLNQAVPNPLAPQGANPTTYYLSFNFGAGSGDVIHNHIPLDPLPGGGGGIQTPTVADLLITKVGPATVAGGTTAAYVITISNAGPADAQNITVTDVLPTGLTLVSVDSQPPGLFVLTTVTGSFSAYLPLLQAGAAVPLNLVVLVDPALSGSTLTNVVSATTTTPDADLRNNTATTSATVLRSDLLITKQGPATMLPGATASYTLTIANIGPSVALNVTATDVIPAGLILISASIVSGTANLNISASGVSVFKSVLLPNGAEPVVIVLVVAVDPSVAGTTITNVAGITATTADSNLNNNTATAVSRVLVPDIQINKQGPLTMVAGSTASYTLTIANIGPGAAANVTVTDALPSGLTLIAASVVSGSMSLVTSTGAITATKALLNGIGLSTIPESVVIRLVVAIDPSIAGTTVTNVAAVTTTTADSNPVNNSSTAVSRVLGVDVQITKLGPETLAAGGTATYTLIVVNVGPSVASNVTVSDALPTGLSLVSASLVSGGSFSFTTSTAGVTASVALMPVGTTVFALNVNIDVTASGTVTNVASATTTTPDTNNANNTSSVSSRVLGADVQVFKFGPPTLTAAGTATYTLVLVNAGPSVAANVTLTDVMPLGLTLLGASMTVPGSLSLTISPETLSGFVPVLRPGTVTVNLTVQVNYTATGTITNVVTATSTTADPSPTNNIASVTSLVKEVESGVILVNKTGNKTVAEVGDSVQYTIRTRNTIFVPVRNVTLEDLLPAGFRYIPGTARLNGTITADPQGGVGRQLIFNIGNLPAQAVYELTYFVRLGVGSQQGDGINRATAIFPGANGAPVRSNTAQFKVNVQGGVFTNDGCIAGKVFVDCDGNAVQNNDGGSRELGIPGVRLVMLDGTYIVTDNEGKYSICGIKPQTQVLKVDRATLPKGSRLVPSSNRNAGVGDSIFVDLKGGELFRADFIEGSCSVEVLDEVKARRAVGGPSQPQTDKSIESLVPVVPAASTIRP